MTTPERVAEDRELDLDALAPDVCSPRDFASADARWLGELLTRGGIPFVRYGGCRRGLPAEVVFIEVDVEVPQHPVYDIRREEPLGIVFWSNEREVAAAPTVFALRRDFPTDPPHLLLTPWDYPRSLCVYDVAFRDVRAQWTPPRFIARVRDWLRLTARGGLHAQDQPLAPLLGSGAGWIILPNAVRAAAERLTPGMELIGSAVRLNVARLPDHRGRLVLRASEARHRDSTRPPPGAHSGFVAAVVGVAPQPHGAIQRAPRTVEELHHLLARNGGDLLGALRISLREWERSEVALDQRVVLVILVPRLREADSAAESIEALAFLTDQTVRELGVAIGVWQLTATGPGAFITADPTRNGAAAQVELLDPIFTLTRGDAARYNGRGAPTEDRLTAIGGGSLGSYVVLNALRAAFGRWALIDEDLLLPHNSARHALPSEAVGLPKASSLAALGNDLTDGDRAIDGLVADVLNPGETAADVSAALWRADAIVDLSASITVARVLARTLPPGPAALGRELGPRRISIFLNPAGTDVTVLAEDCDRSVRLDSLEMQYYRALLHEPALQGALRGSPLRVRYGRSCRDVSVELPQALVALHGGIAARALERIVASPDAQIRVWRVDDATLGVTATSLRPMRTHLMALTGGWAVVTDECLLQQLVDLRARALPNETGGVLVGTFDIAARVAYVVDTIPSPSDSTEQPSHYVRGSAGLDEAIRAIENDTAGQLHYVGEWHAHPEGRPCLPSDDDAKLFSWLAKRVMTDGFPPLMLIVGDDGLVVPYLGELARDGNHPAAFRARSEPL